MHNFLPACQVFLLLPLELDSSGFLVFLLPTSATSHAKSMDKEIKSPVKETPTIGSNWRDFW